MTHQRFALDRRRRQVYTQLGVLELQDKLVENLSGGERKRLGLASALVRRPDVILFDEVSVASY